MDLTDPEILVEASEMPESGQSPKLGPFKGLFFLLLVFLLGFVVQAKVSFDRQADFKDRQDKMEQAIEELQKQSANVGDVRQDVKNLDDKVQKMGDSLNRRLDELMQSEFSRRQAKGQH